MCKLCFIKERAFISTVSFATSNTNRTTFSTSVTWVAPVAQPATTDSVVIATPTTGLDVATAGCKILLIWNKPLP